jgi:CHAD domain-containing protein
VSQADAEAFRPGDDKAFHKWRIRVKNLFYELQILQPVWPERLKKMLAGLEQLQDEIGVDHDLIVLKRSLRASKSEWKDELSRILYAFDEIDAARENLLVPLPSGLLMMSQYSIPGADSLSEMLRTG